MDKSMWLSFFGPPYRYWIDMEWKKLAIEILNIPGNARGNLVMALPIPQTVPTSGTFPPLPRSSDF